MRRRYERNEKSPFTLTPFERDILALRRSGLSYKEMAHNLGLSMNGGALGGAITVATEKDRLRLIHDKRESGVSSLSRARGRVRMDGTK